MSNLAVHQHRSFWPDVSDFFSGLPGWANLRPPFDGHIIKVEDAVLDGKYQLQAEIPGVDPEKDVDVTVRDGVLTIKAERSERKEEPSGRSEFSYGSFLRSVTLPAGADDESIKATYDKGILTVTVPLKESAVTEKHVSIESTK
ncbi:hypothetical protein BVC93_24980 [Mycobacterium sp. MS1601]|uniref:Hsp20/alpha crystallin family protein n=1 Tax=Mycobacterium sp. MS1601 TaxID=1936029 RepID=UPI00097961C1|nr:Hsp20/alpha crystallin family protein [Mycobacterium sp. MS1601]AQA05118.1 hypothetical protein BVC93_24980 [Mycobacterium sp. MS1601]